MKEHEAFAATRSVLYAGWMIATFALGAWFGHYGLRMDSVSAQTTPKKDTPKPATTDKPAERRVSPPVQSGTPVAKPTQAKAPSATPTSAKPGSATPTTPKPATPVCPPPPAKKELTAADLPGIAFDRLKPEQRKLALSLMNKLKFPCSCGQTVARCAKEDLGCQGVQRVVELLMESVFRGQDEKTIKSAIEEPAQGQNQQAPSSQPANASQPKAGTVYHVAVDKSPIKGNPKAKLTVVIFSDFECPYCSQAHQQVDALAKLHGKDSVRFVYRHFPLPFHPNALLAAEASMAAHAQGKFWEYHDKLFANQEKMTKSDLIRYAQEIKLDVERFKKDLESKTYRSLVDADLTVATRLGLPGTPFFFVNGTPVGEDETIADVAKKALAKADELLKKGTKPENLYTELIKGGRTAP